MNPAASRYLPVLGVGVLLLIAAVLYVLTRHESQEDPCAMPQSDISAAILADDRNDTEGLANRAIVQRGACDANRE